MQKLGAPASTQKYCKKISVNYLSVSDGGKKLPRGASFDARASDGSRCGADPSIFVRQMLHKGTVPDRHFQQNVHRN